MSNNMSERAQAIIGYMKQFETLTAQVNQQFGLALNPSNDLYLHLRELLVEELHPEPRRPLPNDLEKARAA